jgi:hypothetical protein
VTRLPQLSKINRNLADLLKLDRSRIPVSERVAEGENNTPTWGDAISVSLTISLPFTGARMSQLVAELLPTLGAKVHIFTYLLY